MESPRISSFRELQLEKARLKAREARLRHGLRLHGKELMERTRNELSPFSGNSFKLLKGGLLGFQIFQLIAQVRSKSAEASQFVDDKTSFLKFLIPLLMRVIQGND